jgi:hypothetical protein
MSWVKSLFRRHARFGFGALLSEVVENLVLPVLFAGMRTVLTA